MITTTTYDDWKCSEPPPEEEPTNDNGHRVGCDCPDCIPPEYKEPS